MKTKRIFALLLAALMIVGLFAGCSKDGTKDPGKTDPGNSLIDQTKPSQTTAKYAYKADYLDLTMPDGVQYNGQAVNGSVSDYAGMFLCGDQPLTVITTDNKNGKTLLVFKESYGNAFVPYMIDYYERIVVVDIREDVGSVSGIISQYGVTDALIINNCQAATSLRSNLESRALS